MTEVAVVSTRQIFANIPNCEMSLLGESGIRSDNSTKV